MKRTRPVSATTRLDPYGLTLNIIFTKDLVKTAIECDVNPEGLEGKAGFASDNSKGEQLIVLDYDCLNYGIIAHESLHCVFSVMKHIGQPMEGGEEAATYLLQHVIDCIITACKMKKIEISQL